MLLTTFSQKWRFRGKNRIDSQRLVSYTRGSWQIRARAD